MAQIDGSPISCGGFSTLNKVIKDCYSFNVATKKWIQISPMKEPRYNHGLFQLSDKEFLTFGQ